MTPKQFLDAYGALGTGGTWLYVLNEPDAKNNIPGLVNWMVEVLRQAKQRGIRVCMFNASTGQPPETTEHQSADWHTGYDPFLREICKDEYRDWAVLGMHEYRPGNPWRIGRVNWLQKSVTRLGLRPPRTVLTEYGWDAADHQDPLNGFRTRGITEQQLFNDVAEDWNQTYKRLPWVEGMCMFMYGGNGDRRWEPFRVDNARVFIELVGKNFEHIPEAPVNVLPFPKPEDSGWAEVIISPANQGGGFIRNQPSASAPEVGRFATGNRARLHSTRYNKWAPIVVNGVTGWTHADYFVATPVAQGPVTAVVAIIGMPNNAQLEAIRQGAGILSGAGFVVHVTD